MTAALRHLVDDVKDRFSRLRSRPVSAPRLSTNSDALPPSGRSKNPSVQNSRQAVSVRSTGNGNATDRIDPRTQTPDLIRPHVSAMTSLPPLPPTSSVKPKNVTSANQRTSTTGRQVDSGYLSMHVYEEIPTMSRLAEGNHRRVGSNRSSASTSSAPETLGRIYYISPMDGALCRLYPAAGSDQLADRRDQIVCHHVRSRGWSHPLDVAAIADLITGSSAYGVRGRELRLCSECRRQLREILGESSTDLNTCDLSLLHVPCPYTSDDDGVDERHEQIFSGKEKKADISGASSESSEQRRRGRIDVPLPDHVEGDVVGNAVRKTSVGDEARKVDDIDGNSRRLRPSLGIEGRSAFSKFAIGRRNSLPVSSSTSGRMRTFKPCDSNCAPSSEYDISFSGRHVNVLRDMRRLPLIAGNDDHVMRSLSSTSADDKDQSQPEVKYLCLYGCQCNRCTTSNKTTRNSGRRRSKHSKFADHQIGNIGDDNHDLFNNNLNDDDKLGASNGHVNNWSRGRPKHPNRRSLMLETEFHRESSSVVHVDDWQANGPRQKHLYRRQQSENGESSQRTQRPPIKSVYYNGLLASMIDLTGRDVISSGVGSNESRDHDRLSCRATSGPKSWGLEMLRNSRSSRKYSDEQVESGSKAADHQLRRIQTSCGTRCRPTADNLTGYGRNVGTAAGSVGDLQLSSVR